MKQLLVWVLVLGSVKTFSQTTLPANSHVISGIYDARRMQRPPVFPYGIDSCQRFYFSHFSGFDSVLTNVIERGDTAKYIRVYFSFIVDKDGSAMEPHFVRVASTLYAKSEGARTIAYFFDNKPYYEAVIKKMIYKMPFWKPGLGNLSNANSMVAVDAQVENYIQFWVGINPPTN